MYDSGISAKEMISMLQTEVDIALPIPNKTYIDWLNAIEQFLYSGIIHDQQIYTDNNVQFINGTANIILSDIDDKIIYDDIYTVYIDYPSGIQLIKCNTATADLFNNCYYGEAGDKTLHINYPDDSIKSVTVIYFSRPPLKTVDSSDNIDDGNVAVPLEFVDMIRAKLRAEAYMLVNENLLASNWFNVYNTQLEYFKQWLQQRSAQFGM